MQLKDIDNYYFDKPEPVKSCLLALRKIILDHHPNLRETWKYKTPCFEYHGKMCCYLWIDKKTKWPYIGIVKGCEIVHPDLSSGGRKQIKTFLVDPSKDIPIKKLNSVLEVMLNFYRG